MLISETLTKINLNSSKINKFLKSISDEVSELSAALNRSQQVNTQVRIAELQKENHELENQIEKYKHELSKLRAGNSIPEIPIPKTSNPVASIKKVSSVLCQKTAPAAATPISDAPPSATPPKDAQPVTSKKNSKKATSTTEEEEDIHFGRLDIRVGKIVNVEKHPNADSLYVEQVDVGDEKPKTILSGLVKFVPIEEMKGRVALFLCNLKPAKMRGISSEGMIMCANGGENVEILEPPAGCTPGDVVTVDGFERKPDLQLNPKKKIFETVQVDLKTNDEKVATYKGIPWNVGGKGPAVSKSLPNTIIK